MEKRRINTIAPNLNPYLIISKMHIPSRTRLQNQMKSANTKILTKPLISQQ
jgi:hypothetical protein